MLFHLEEEITEKNIGDCIELKVDGSDKRAKLFAFGRGNDWIEKQMSNRPVGRNGESIKLNLASDTDTLHVLCEVEGGQLMIMPYGKDYEVEVFGYGIFKNQWYDENISEVIYPRNLTRFAISYVESLELFAKIATTDINNCKIAVVEHGDGRKKYLGAFNETCLDLFPILTYIPTVEQCICMENYIEYIYIVHEARTGNCKISILPVKDAYYKSMKENPVIRMRANSFVNRLLGLTPNIQLSALTNMLMGCFHAKMGLQWDNPALK